MIEQDVKFAWRMFVRRPAFTAISVLILALGIGANATIFSWVESIVLNPLSGVANQHRLVALNGTYGSRHNLSFSYPAYADIRAAKPAGLTDVMAFRIIPTTVRAGGEPARAFGELVTGNFFDMLGVRAALGRTFAGDEADTPAASPVVVISDAFWRRMFAADTSALGRAVDINGTPFTIVGVLPPAFRGSVAGLALDLYVPMGWQKAVMPGDRLGNRHNSWLEVYGQMAGDSTLAQVRAGLSTIARRLEQAHPDSDEGRGITAVPLSQADASAMLGPVMATLMAFVGLVLIIACANLAGLLLARASARHREIAVRLAVGASRGRLVRQLLVESLLLSVAGGAAGLLVAMSTSRTLSLLVPPSPYPIAFDAHVNPRVVAFTCCATLLTAIVAGLLPAGARSAARFASAADRRR